MVLKTKRASAYAIACGVIVAKDLIAHSSKKRKEQLNILPHFYSPSSLKPALSMPKNIALRRTELRGAGGEATPLQKNYLPSKGT